MLARRSVSSRAAHVERESEQLVGVVRTLLKMHAEAAARESALARRVATLEARIAACEAGACGPISEADEG